MSSSETSAIEGRQQISALDRWCRRSVLYRIDSLESGNLQIFDVDGCWQFGPGSGREAHVDVHDGRFWRMLASGGSVGAGEAYIAGLWDSPDLVDVIRVLAANRKTMVRMERGSARIQAGMLRLLHLLARNSLSGSRRNIAAHYDLGNDFFACWLDETMQYSAALFHNPDETLDRAQINKLERIAKKLELGANDHLLEIGTGWGGLAVHMARTTGCRVTTTTISRQQHELAVERVRRAGMEHRISVLLKDYRELQGRFDKVVSVEMIEAVGADYLETYLECIESRLKPDGLALIQAITIEDYRYVPALQSVDYIKRHIFPGSFIPSISAITGAMARASDLGLVDLFDFGDSYALTLQHWRERFDAAWPEIREMGFDESFRRRWRFYLAYCEGGFRERAISDVHLLLARPGYRRQGWLA